MPVSYQQSAGQEIVLFGERAQVAEGEQARVVAVAPDRLDRVPAHQLDVDHLDLVGLQLGAILELARELALARARCARATPTQVLPVVVAAPTVGPHEPQAPTAGVELDVDGPGCVSGVRHVRQAYNFAGPVHPACERDRGAWLWLAGLLVIVSLSLADGLLTSTVAYERDTAVFYFPLMSWLSEQLHQGNLPLWTPQFFGGYPIFADGEIGLAYPPVLLALLVLPPDRAFVILRLAHLCLAAAGEFFLARTWGLPNASAFIAGLVLALGNLLQAQIHHENIVRTVSWLPLVLALVERGLRTPHPRAQLRWNALAAGEMGLAGVGLHSQMLALGLMILAAYGGVGWGVGPPEVRPGDAAVDRGHVGGFAAAAPGAARGMPIWASRLLHIARVCVPVAVLGLGLAAVQLAPLIELAGFSARGSGIPYAESAAYSLTPYGLVQLVFPYVFRGPRNVQWGLWTHWESYVYVGLVPLVLAVVALAGVRRREVLGWGAMTGLGLLLALGQYSAINLHYLLW